MSNPSEPSPSPSLSLSETPTPLPPPLKTQSKKPCKARAHSATDVAKIGPSSSKDQLPSTSTTSKVRSLQFSFSCTKKNRSPSDEGEMDSEDACDRSTASNASQTANTKGSSTQKPRVRSNTISRHTKSQCKPSPLNTNTLPNPKSRGHHRSTTHPRTSIDSIQDRAAATIQQLADFVVSSASSVTAPVAAPVVAAVTAPVTPTSSSRAKGNLNPTSSSSSGIDSALSAAAMSYASQSGFLQDYSCFAGRTTPPPEYQEYSPSDENELRLGHTYMTPLPRPASSNVPTVPAPSEYQEPDVEPPPLPLPNVRPDSPECSASSLDDSLGSLKYQPPLLLTDYLDFPSPRSKGQKSKSKCKSASPRTPRTPDSGLHHDLISDSGMVVAKSSSAKSSAPSLKTVHDAAAIKSNAAALLQYAFEKNASTVARKHDGATRAVSSSAGSHDACGLCASLGSPWVDICRAVRASKTK